MVSGLFKDRNGWTMFVWNVDMGEVMDTGIRFENTCLISQMCYVDNITGFTHSPTIQDIQSFQVLFLYT